MAGFSSLLSIITVFLSIVWSCESFAYPDQGKWDFRLDEQNDQVAVVKSLFKESEIRIQITCDSKSDAAKLTVSWSLGEVACWRDYLHINEALSRSVPPNDLQRALDNASFYTFKSNPEEHDCDHNIQLKEMVISEDVSYTDVQSESAGIHGMPQDPGVFGSRLKREAEQQAKDQAKEGEQGNKQSKQQEKESEQNKATGQHDQRQVLKQIHTQPATRPVTKVTKDGFYMLSLQLASNAPFSADVHIEMKGKHGYLSAADWPLLPFYGAMCLVYVVLGLAWLIVSFLQWRDLLRIQFWIGGVILLGMLEKAMFYAEYQSINTTGQTAQTAVLLAEFVSCGKRTLARMLVIIVSLGFGIVKPRLGPMLHRTVATGMVYFLLAATEAYLRVMRPKSDPANQLLVASVPLAVVDSAICWWIFTSLVQTTRTLRLRRNMVKLNLYRHFTNTLIFAVISSVVFMLYSIKAHYLVNCFTAWKELWIDDAYWKLLFSVILLVIMILWRPTNNNQRYAFTPLLDAPEDGDDEEEEYFVSDAYGVKMRGGLNSGANSPKQKLSMNSAEEDLKWVEENIPTSLADSALPILDSDEEIMNTKFELSKMQ